MVSNQRIFAQIVAAEDDLKIALDNVVSEKVVTGDAIHTQRGLSSQILAGLGDYVFPVKEHQPQLYKNIRSLFAPEYPKPGFGKIATDFQTSSEVEYGITSLSRKQACPLQVLKTRRCHWGIETGLHYRRDVTFREDATHMTIGNLGKVMASINNLVLALIRQAKFQNAAQARRWFAAHIPQAFAILTTPFPRL